MVNIKLKKSFNSGIPGTVKPLLYVFIFSKKCNGTFKSRWNL